MYLHENRQDFNSEDEFKEILNHEIMLNENIESKNVIYMYCAVRVEQSIYFFFHFYNGRMLSDLIKLKHHIDEKLVAQIVKQLLEGLIAMHDGKYIHRDLKPDNILLHFDWMPQDKPVSKEFLTNWDYKVNSCFTIVIADLGMGREINELHMSANVGTPLYRAPEVSSDQYDAKSDVLSVGIITYELLTGEPIFTSRKAKNLKGLVKLWN